VCLPLGSVVLPGRADAVRVSGRVHARRAGHVDAALARWPAIELRRYWARSPAELCALVTGLLAVELERVLRSAARRVGRWRVAPWFRGVHVLGQGYVSIVVGGV